MLQAEVENGQSLIIRMENHINSLNNLLLPHEFVQRIVEPEAFEMPNFYGSEFKHNSDSSDDDMMADYGSVSIPKPTNETKHKNNLDFKTSHIDFMNVQKLINEQKRDNIVLSNKNDVLAKHNHINEILLKQLSHLAASSFSNKSGQYKSSNLKTSSEAKNERIVNILMNGKTDELGLDDRSKFKILQEISVENSSTDE